MNEDNNAMSNDEAFENLLRTVRPTSPCNAEETFFQAGWAAALKQQGLLGVEEQCEQPLGKRLVLGKQPVQDKRRVLGSWSTFSSGLAAGLAAGLLASVIWLRPVDSGTNNRGVASTKNAAPEQSTPRTQSTEQIVPSDKTSSRNSTELTSEKESSPFVWDSVAWLTQWATGARDQPAISDSPKRLTARFVDTKQFNDTLRWTPSRGDASASTKADSPSIILRYQPMQAESVQDLL
jgi:hypothetical protein